MLLASDGRDLVILARRTGALEALAARLREERP
jgi:short-subunit dehydrogenase